MCLLTSLPPAGRGRCGELDCRQIWCSPGLRDVNLKNPSEPLDRDRITWREPNRKEHYLNLTGSVQTARLNQNLLSRTNLVIRIYGSNIYPDVLRGRQVLVFLFIIQLSPVVTCRETETTNTSLNMSKYYWTYRVIIYWSSIHFSDLINVLTLLTLGYFRYYGYLSFHVKLKQLVDKTENDSPTTLIMNFIMTNVFLFQLLFENIVNWILTFKYSWVIK